MKKERILQIIVGAHITEKTALISENKQLVFKVIKNATKEEIKLATQQLLETDVLAVNTVNIKGKQRRTRRGMGRLQDYKKAYITLDKNVDVDALLADRA